MSDVLCGPSNPLQQFKQQTQLDRTLQQDRLASRASPSQGFRSANQNAGLLDPEFEAFQAGVPTPDLPQFNHVQRPPQFAGPSSQPSWATDFQQLHISQPPFQQHLAPQAAPASAGWAQGFQQHIAQTTPKAQQSAPSPQAFQYMARYGMNGYQNHFAEPNFAPSIQSKGKEVATEQWDDAAFDRAFNQVSDALSAEQEAMDVEKDAYANGTSTPYQRGASTGNVLETETYEARVEEGDLDLEFQRERAEIEKSHAENLLRIKNQQDETFDILKRLESDPVAEEMLREETDSAMYASDSEMEEQKQEQDDDALAKTAQELLEKVEHNNTDKFRNSQFLSLMRKLRDREMKVEGNDMVETNVRATSFNKLASSPPPRAYTPDSAYVSGTASPSPYTAGYPVDHIRRSPPPEFDSHIEYGWDEEHEFDHWESPYR
jgi:hypothetical protein